MGNYCYNQAFLWDFGKAKVNNVKFIITVVVVSKKSTTFGSILSAEKVVMNEKCKFQLILIPKIRLRFKNNDFCVISESHSILSLCLSDLMEPRYLLQNLKNFTHKMFNLFWKPRYSKLQKNYLIWFLVQTIFFVHAKFEHDMITERT